MQTPINLNNDGSIWNKTAPNGDPLIVGHMYEFKGSFWIYAGDFKTIQDVPNVQCCYTVGDEIRIRQYIKVTPMIREKVKRKRVDDGRPIITDITDEDNELMAMMKTAIREKGVTRGDFKQLYDNDSDMNNSLRCIEGTGNLSFPKFADLCGRLGLKFEIGLYDSDNTPIVKPGEKIKVTVTKKKKK